MRHEKIPKALACDNFIGYAHEFILEHRVTWLEATIALPVFSGLVTYYIEGPPAARRNLMDTPVAQAHLSYGVRGNLFSFLLPWEQVLRQLHDKVEDGDLSQWPLSPEHVRQDVRVRFERGQESLVDKWRDLYVRSGVVKRMAEIYIDRKIAGLEHRDGILKIHARERCHTIAASLKQHAHNRVDEMYPRVLHTLS